ncbi:hypothetical protein GTQ40_10635 [Flavobacteriaceae bacterium R38]|nr:hypothetical protein [Flavobacteriaceae bacterium R38]
MLKNILKLDGAHIIKKDEQREINGGKIGCPSSCAGRPRGARCYSGGHCDCPGECGSNGQCNIY